MPYLTQIGVACRCCGAKNLKIAWSNVFNFSHAGACTACSAATMKVTQPCKKWHNLMDHISLVVLMSPACTSSKKLPVSQCVWLPMALRNSSVRIGYQVYLSRVTISILRSQLFSHFCLNIQITHNVFHKIWQLKSVKQPKWLRDHSRSLVLVPFEFPVSQ